MKAIDEATVKAFRTEALVDLLQLYLQCTDIKDDLKVDKALETLDVISETVKGLREILANAKPF